MTLRPPPRLHHIRCYQLGGRACPRYESSVRNGYFGCVWCSKVVLRCGRVARVGRLVIKHLDVWGLNGDEMQFET